MLKFSKQVRDYAFGSSCLKNLAFKIQKDPCATCRSLTYILL